MKKIVRLTESDLVRLVKRVINEQDIPAKPKIGDTVFVYDEKNPGSKNFVGDVCGYDAKYIFLKSNSTKKCVELPWHKYLNVKKTSNNSYEVTKSDLNLFERDCKTYCNTRIPS